MKSKKNKKIKRKPITYKVIIKSIGIGILCTLLILAMAARIWHYYHHHSK